MSTPTLQQSPTEAITAKGSVPMTLFKPGTGEHVDESANDTVDLHVKSTALNLGIVQGFTTQVTDVSGTLEADVHITGSGQDPHLQGFVDIKNGAFSVPAGGVSYSGLNTRIDLEPDKVRLQKFAILDEHGQPLNVSGELAVHARQVGAVNIAIDSDNFEVIDNELGDVGIDSDAHRHRRAAPAADSRHHPARGGAARGRPDPAAVLRPVFGGGAAAGRLRRAHGGIQRQRAGSDRRGAEEGGDHGGGAGHTGAGRGRDRSGAGRRVRAGRTGSPAARSRTTSCCAAGSCGRAARPARRSAT